MAVTDETRDRVRETPPARAPYAAYAGITGTFVGLHKTNELGRRTGKPS